MKAVPAEQDVSELANELAENIHACISMRYLHIRTDAVNRETLEIAEYLIDMGYRLIDIPTA